MTRQPAETQTLYAELSERLRALDAARSFASLTGSFAKKQVRAGDYWYFKTSEGPAGQREYFVGPDDAETRSVMAAYAASIVCLLLHRRAGPVTVAVAAPAA